MDERRNHLLTIGLIACIFLVLAGANLFSEGTIDAAEVSEDTVLSGAFGEDYEADLKERFVGTEKWKSVWNNTELLLGKRCMNGVYIGSSGQLFAVHGPSDYAQELVDAQVDDLKQLVLDWDADVLLVPTADNILTDRLPAFAPYYDETALLSQVQEAVGDEHYIDAFSTLSEHADEYIYYRTEERITSLGAYYAFLAWSDFEGKYPYPYRSDRLAVVTDSFVGGNGQKLGSIAKTDSISVFPETLQRKVSVVTDQGTHYDSYYEPSAVGEENVLDYFLGETTAFLEIQTDYHPGSTLFVVGDSTAEILIPLLGAQYERIYLVNPKEYRGDLSELLRSCQPDTGMDVLVLYDCISFLNTFTY